MKVSAIINSLKFLICFLILGLIFSCKKNFENNFYEQSFPVILDSYFSHKLKYQYPKYDSLNDKIIEVPFADADTMPKLKVYVQKMSFPIENLNKDYINRVPKEFRASFDSSTKAQNYIPENVEEYISNKYNIHFIDNYKEVVTSENFKKYDLSSGGILQFSYVIFNKEKNKALIFIRWCRSKLNGNESFSIFHLENGKWIDKGGLELSVS